jgi:hypothetical protein
VPAGIFAVGLICIEPNIFVAAQNYTGSRPKAIRRGDFKKSPSLSAEIDVEVEVLDPPDQSNRGLFCHVMNRLIKTYANDYGRFFVRDDSYRFRQSRPKCYLCVT